MEGEDTEEIKRLSEALTQASHKLAEAMYQQASQDQGQPEGGPDGTDGSSTCRLRENPKTMLWMRISKK
jgi:molecular chaperone DnaK